MSNELMSYFLAWHEEIKTGPHATVVYDAMGPDLVTPLHLFDPKVVRGTNYLQVDPKKLQFYLDRWDIVDTDTASLPHNLRLLSLGEISQGDVDRNFKNDINCRTRSGFWLDSGIATWSIERCLVMDLKGMGIGRRSIKVGEEAGLPCLTFKWGLPGHFSTTRKFLFYPGPLAAGPEGVYVKDLRNEGKIPVPAEFDCYYSKSGNDQQRVFNISPLWPLLARRISRGGGMFGGVPQLCEPGEEEQIITAIRQSLGAPFNQLQIADTHARRLQAAGVEPYGWKLFGWRRT